MEHSKSKNIYKNPEFEIENSNFPVDLSHKAFEILGDEVYREFTIRERLSKYAPQDNIEFLNRLEPENIFLLEDIKNLCSDLRLRFLETEFFKSEFPQEAISKIKALENKLDKDFSSFKIAAPSKCFKKENQESDSILFLQLNSDVYYLIHLWGKPVSLLRKIFSWPVKNPLNLGIVSLLLVLTTVFFIPLDINIVDTLSYELFARLSIALILFTGLVSIVSFLGFAFYKDVSSKEWNSPYFNTSK